MSKLKNCKACEKEIGTNVKKCVHCGTDQRSWFGKHKVLTTIGGIIVLSGIAGAMGGEEKTNNGTEIVQKQGEKVENKQEKIYAVNDVINTGDVEVSVTTLENKDKVGDEFFVSEPSEGGTYVILNYKMKNTSDKPVSSFSLPSIQLIDENGTKYDSDIDASSSYATEVENDQKILSDLNPGIATNGSDVFEIAKEYYETKKWFVLIDNKHKVELK